MKIVCPQTIVYMYKRFAIKRLTLYFPLTFLFVLYLSKTATICHTVSLLVFIILLSLSLYCSLLLYCSLFVKCVHVILVRNTCMNRLCVCVCVCVCVNVHRHTYMNVCVCAHMSRVNTCMRMFVCQQHLFFFFLYESRL